MQYKRVCYIFVALLGISSAISTKAKQENVQTVSTGGQDPVLPSPTPSSSTEYSSRQGTSDEKNKNEENFKPSVKFGNFAPRSLNSSGSEPSKSHTSYLDPTDEKSVDKDGPQSVVLKLLDEKDDEERPISRNGDKEKDYEGRSKFPRIYYGEVSPPYSAHEDEPINASGPKHLAEKEQEEEPKYYYPKNYMNKQNEFKGKKKRFEYKHEEPRHSVPENSEPAQGNHGSYHTPEDLHYQGKDFNPQSYGHGHQQHYGQEHTGHGHSDNGEHDHGHHVHGYGYGPSDQESGHPAPHYRHGHGSDVIGRALKVLIPSALFLTGVSALFPNRLHVPTNDYTHHSQHQRHRRSVNFNNAPPEFGRDFELPTARMLEAEHRGMNDEVPQSYEYDVGRYGEYQPEESPDGYPQPQTDFENFQTSNEHSLPVEKVQNYGQKTGIDEKFRRPFISRPSTPQEYDDFNYGPQTKLNFMSESGPDSQVFAPSLSIQDSIQRDSEMVPVSELQPETEKPQKRQKGRGRQGARSKKRSRPLPTPTQAPAIPIQDFQPIPTEETYQVVKPDNYEQGRKLPVVTGEGHKKLQDLLASYETDDKSKVESTRSLSSHDEHKELGKEVDLSPDGPVMGLITSYAQHDRESPACQKRALCELAIKGKNPNASKFESFLWSLATLVPEQFSRMYELEDIFKAIRAGDCGVFNCANPNLDLQAK